MTNSSPCRWSCTTWLGHQGTTSQWGRKSAITWRTCPARWGAGAGIAAALTPPLQVKEDTINVVFVGKPRGLTDLAHRQRKPGQWVREGRQTLMNRGKLEIGEVSSTKKAKMIKTKSQNHCKMFFFLNCFVLDIVQMALDHPPDPPLPHQVKLKQNYFL